MTSQISGTIQSSNVSRDEFKAFEFDNERMHAASSASYVEVRADLAKHRKAFRVLCAGCGIHLATTFGLLVAVVFR